MSTPISIYENHRDELDWKESTSFAELDKLIGCADKVDGAWIRDGVDTIGRLFCYLMGDKWLLVELMDRNGDMGATMRRAIRKPEEGVF